MATTKPVLCQLGFLYEDQAVSASKHSAGITEKGVLAQVLAKMASALLLVALCVCSPFLYAQGVNKIDKVEVATSDADRPPPDTGAWQTQKLPWFRSFLVNPQVPDYIWLRFELPQG